MFADRLRAVSDRIGDAMTIALVAGDGVPVESWPKQPEHDVEILAAEFMTQVQSISQNHEELNAGGVRQLTIDTDQLTVMVSALTRGYYLLLVLRAGANKGRARFELRRAVLSFERDLV